MNSLKVHYSCVVDNDPKFIWQVNIFINTLISIGVNPKTIFINLVFKNELFENELKNLGVNVHLFDKFGDKKYCNKLVQFYNLELANCDYVFLCDCDIAFVKSLENLAKEKIHNLIGKPVDAANPPLDVLEAIFSHYHKNIGTVVDVYNGKSSTFNINGGFIGLPSKNFYEFGLRWQHFALALLEDVEVKKTLGNYSKHIDQISFSLAASEVNYFDSIDVRYNFPIHSQVFIDMNNRHVEDIHCLHYHDKLSSLGLIEFTNNNIIDSNIAKVNKIIKENFNNRIFWDFLYSYSHELGSGQGSRGEIKEKKRKILQNFGVETYENVIDFGCGDGEALRSLILNGYIGIDASEEALRKHQLIRPTGNFYCSGEWFGNSLKAELVLCFEVLIHQQTKQDFDDVIDNVVAATTKRLIISGYESERDLDHSHMCFYYAPLKQVLLETGKFGSVYKIAQYDNISIFVADIENVSNQHTESSNDIEGSVLNQLSHDLSDTVLNNLYACVSISRSRFGWYTKHLPRVSEYPWLLSLLPYSLDGKVIGEFGSGLSPLPFILSQRGATVFTIDAGPDRTNEDLSKANEWGYFNYNTLDSGVQAYNQYLDASTFPNNSFDAWYSISVIEHVSSDVRRNILSNISNSLKLDGKLYLTLDLIKNETGLWNYCEGRQVEEPSEHGTLSTIMAELELLGFSIQAVKTQATPETERVDIAYIEATKTFPVFEKDEKLNSKFKNKTLLVTGFHRSATSAIANYLNDAGLDMGSNLMGGNISNVKGHFEDWDAVLLHDEQLGKNKTNWQFYDDVELQFESGFLDSYIQKRSDRSGCWGVKDPRACLFLKEWQQALGDAGHYLFVARHWSSCIESLLHRHSRDLAYGLSSINRDTVGAQFWVQPELAAKMWLSYNKRIVEFAKKNPDTTIVATQRALFQGAPILKELNAKFGFELDEESESPFDASLFRDKANQRIFAQLSYSLQAQLNAVWNDLLELATFRSEDEAPHIVNDELRQEDLAKVEALISSHTVVNLSANDTVRQGSTWLEECLLISNPSAMAKFLDASSVSRLSVIQVSDWLPKIQEQFALDGDVILAVAKLLQRLKEYRLAIDNFQASVSLGVYFPYVDMMMAQCWQALGKQKRAEFFFKKSIKGNPNNPIFYTNYAKLLLELNREVEAEQLFELGYQKGSAQPACSVPYCDFLDRQGKTQKAIDIASACLKEANSSAIQSLLTRLMLKNNVDQGKAHYSEIIKQELANKDTLGWLVQSCKVIDSAQAEEDFMIRCLSHWRRLPS